MCLIIATAVTFSSLLFLLFVLYHFHCLLSGYQYPAFSSSFSTISFAFVWFWNYKNTHSISFARKRKNPRKPTRYFVIDITEMSFTLKYSLCFPIWRCLWGIFSFYRIFYYSQFYFLPSLNAIHWIEIERRP